MSRCWFSMAAPPQNGNWIRLCFSSAARANFADWALRKPPITISRRCTETFHF